MEQPTFADLVYDAKKRDPPRDLLGAPQKLEERIRFYAKPGQGRPVMLRIHCVQLFYNLSDPGMEDPIRGRIGQEVRGSESGGGFAGRDHHPELPHLLERHEREAARSTPTFAGTLREGTIHASIIEAPSSTKNRAGERDPEMHQTKKGNQWHFGMKAHIGVDSETGIVHSLSTTAASTT